MSRIILALALFIFAGCAENPTAPDVTVEPETIDVVAAFGCVQFSGTDRWQCDTYGDAQNKIDEVGIDGALEYDNNSGKWVFLEQLQL